MERNELEETVFSAITALNALMQNQQVCKSDKAVMKINRFKNWVNEFTNVLVTNN